MSLNTYDRPVSELGAKLREWRLRRKISQETLGARLGHKRPSTVQSWESGRRPPKPKYLQALADALELSDDERRTAMDLLSGIETKTGRPGKAVHRLAPAVAPAPIDPLVSAAAEAIVSGKLDPDLLLTTVNYLRFRAGLPIYKPSRVPSRARSR